MGLDRFFHRIFLSAAATITLAVIVAVGYIAKNENFGLATDNSGSCSTELMALLGSGCRTMGNAYFNSAMDQYILPNSTVVQNCATNYISGCSTGGSSSSCSTGYYWNGTSCVASNTTTCSAGQYWNGTACVSSTTTVGQTTQTWNSFGLSSQIRTDADPARIAQLIQACANVPNGANIWMPNAGVSTSVDFGMPDPAKCSLAAACTSTQYFNGTSCTASSTTCPTGQSWSGTACVSSGGTSSGSNWVNKVWTFKDGTHNSYILNRTDSDYLNYLAGIEAQCLQINKSQFTWKPNAGNDSVDNWQNFGIPDCSTSSGSSNTSSCPSAIVSLLGSGCRSMSSAYFDSAMTNYVLFGASTVISCATTYLSGCSSGGSTNTTCSAGQYWNGTACVSSTTTVGQTTQTWNSFGLSSQIRTDADPARIAQLIQACANVPNGANIWMPNAGVSTSVDFGMPDPAKCSLAAACTPTQYFNGTSCTASSTTCPTGQSWSGTACVANNTDTTTSASCPTTVVALLGSSCHNMGNAYFNGAMDKYVLLETTTVKSCSSAPITNCPGQSPWTVPSEWKEIIWNSLGLRSYVSVNASSTVIDAAKKACANTRPDQVVWPNPSDFSKPESAGIPDCSTATTTITYPFRFAESGRTCNTYQECFDYCKTTPGSGTGDLAICDKHFPGATTYKTITKEVGQIIGQVKDASGHIVDDFFGFVYLETSGGSSGGAAVERGLFTMSVLPGTYRLVLEVPRSSRWTPTGPLSLGVEAGKTAEATFMVKRNISEIWGFVVDADSKPLVGVPIKVFASGKNGIWQETTVDQKTGRYSFSVSAGTWFLKAAAAEGSEASVYFQQHAERSITVTEGERGQLDIILLHGKSTISGAVLNPRGQPFANAWVAVETRGYESSTDTDPKTVFADLATGTRTNINGRFVVTVPPGTYYIHVFAVQKDGLINPPEQSVTLQAGEKKEITLSFRSTNTVITGQVFAESKPIKAFISAWSERGGYVETNSKEDGTYALPVNSRDTWRLVASAKYQDALYRSSAATVTPGESGEIVQNLSVERERDLPSPVVTTANANQPNVIATEDGTRVSLPANSIAAAGRATVTIAPDAALPQQGSSQVVGVGYEVKAFNESGQTVTKLNSAITITIPYDPDELKAKGLEPAGLKIAFWDDTSNVWRNLTASVVNEKEHLVTATVDHLTRFAIVAAADITPPDQPTTVSANADAGGGIVLGWANPTKDFSHAKIYRSSESGKLGTILATDLATPAYVDKNVIAGRIYHYTVRAVDPAGNESVNTNQVTATAASTTAAPAAESKPSPAPSAASTLARRLAGRILLQVESQGEAWYVNPQTLKRYYLGRPSDALRIMREQGLGITNINLSKVPEPNQKAVLPRSLTHISGRILLQVESKGEAWYIHPQTLKRHYLGRPADAFAIMRSLGLGITNANLNTISVSANSPATP